MRLAAKITICSLFVLIFSAGCSVSSRGASDTVSSVTPEILIGTNWSLAAVNDTKVDYGGLSFTDYDKLDVQVCNSYEANFTISEDSKPFLKIGGFGAHSLVICGQPTTHPDELSLMQIEGSINQVLRSTPAIKLLNPYVGKRSLFLIASDGTTLTFTEGKKTPVDKPLPGIYSKESEEQVRQVVRNFVDSINTANFVSLTRFNDISYLSDSIEQRYDRFLANPQAWITRNHSLLVKHEPSSTLELSLPEVEFLRFISVYRVKVSLKEKSADSRIIDEQEFYIDVKNFAAKDQPAVWLIISMGNYNNNFDLFLTRVYNGTGFSLRYPYLKITDLKEYSPISRTAGRNYSSSDAALVLGRINDLTSSRLRVFLSVRRGTSTPELENCTNYKDLPQFLLPITISTKKIDGLNFTVARTSYKEPDWQHEVVVYRTVHHRTCYELALTYNAILAGGTTVLYSPENRKEADVFFNSIIDSFKVLP